MADIKKHEDWIKTLKLSPAAVRLIHDLQRVDDLTVLFIKCADRTPLPVFDIIIQSLMNPADLSGVQKEREDRA